MPEQVLYLQPGGRLGDAVPPDTAPAPSFTYDPAHPTPTVGGRLLSPEGGYRTDDKLAERADVLTFTGDTLPQDLYVVGHAGPRTVALVRQPAPRRVRAGQ